MAGVGPAPKPPEQRRNRSVPMRSEWTELPETLDKPILPAYQPSFTIPRYFWNLWREDPLTSQYENGDMATALYLAREWVLLNHAERRQLMDRLGLNPKARRDLRWRTQLEAKQQREATAKVKKLRLVSKE